MSPIPTGSSDEFAEAAAPEPTTVQRYSQARSVTDATKSRRDRLKRDLEQAQKDYEEAASAERNLSITLRDEIDAREATHD